MEKILETKKEIKTEKIEWLEDVIDAMSIVKNYDVDPCDILEYLDREYDREEMGAIVVDDGEEIDFFVKTHGFLENQYCSVPDILQGKVYWDFPSLNIQVYIPCEGGEFFSIIYDVAEWSVEEMIKDLNDKLLEYIGNFEHKIVRAYK